MREAIAIIPARGGSKRIPGKNIRPFAGRPVICHAIEAALQSQCFAEVMVSTDSPEIAAVAQDAGAKVPFFRCAATSGDHATTYDALAEVLEVYRLQGRVFELGCCLYPVTPFLMAERVRCLMTDIGDQSHLDSIVTVQRYAHPIQRALRIQEGRVTLFSPEWAATRTQDLEPAYHDAGQCYAFRVSSLLEHRSLFCPTTAAMILGDDEAQDIDTLEDWANAEMKYAILQNRKASL